MRQFTAYIRAQADFKLFMFDGTLCIFEGAFRRFASRFQIARTIICNNHCTQTLFLRVGKMDFCPTRFQIGRLCSSLTVSWWCPCRCTPLTTRPSLAMPSFVRRVMCPKSCFVIRITDSHEYDNQRQKKDASRRCKYCSMRIKIIHMTKYPFWLFSTKFGKRSWRVKNVISSGFSF